MVTRRDFFQAAACVLTLPAGARFFALWLDAAARPQRGAHQAPAEPRLLAEYSPQFFDVSDFAALEAFTAILIPTDETPGAREAHCALFIDFVLHNSAGVAPELQQQWRTAMEALRRAGFHAGDASARASLVEQMSRPEREAGATHPAYFAYRLIKQQNTFAFYTSRAGIIENLDYRGNSYYAEFPACTHPEHQRL